MKFLTSFFVAALCVSTCGIAQTLSGSETSSSSAVTSASGDTYLGSMTVTATVPSSTSTSTVSSTSDGSSTGTLDASKPTKGTRTTYEIFIFRTSGGQVDYRLNVSSIRVEDSASIIDGISTADLFNFLGREAVRQGIALGYTSYTSVEDNTPEAKAWSEYDIRRIGTGSATRFYPYDSQTMITRGYSAYKESGSVSPTVSLVSTAITKSASSSTTIQ